MQGVRKTDRNRYILIWGRTFKQKQKYIVYIFYSFIMILYILNSKQTSNPQINCLW